MTVAREIITHESAPRETTPGAASAQHHPLLEILRELDKGIKRWVRDRSGVECASALKALQEQPNDHISLILLAEAAANSRNGGRLRPSKISLKRYRAASF